VLAVAAVWVSISPPQNPSPPSHISEMPFVVRIVGAAPVVDVARGLLFGSEGSASASAEVSVGGARDVDVKLADDSADDSAAVDAIVVAMDARHTEPFDASKATGATVAVFVLPVLLPDAPEDAELTPESSLESSVANGGTVLARGDGEDMRQANLNIIADACARQDDAREAQQGAEQALGNDATADEFVRLAEATPTYLASLPPNQYLEQTVMPVLSTGLARLAAVRCVPTPAVPSFCF
jgi:hypothetical protein